ncbi:tetraacyldisaccharide 4'-kinase [Acidovorax sp.]|uniref:tetraacyldisaccharide 4'-kinase n=1 Tax=Acidovorax sp. TaxID=1872122 RepID=UPI003918D476
MAASGPQPPSSASSPKPSSPSLSSEASASAQRGLPGVWQTRGAAAWALWPVSLLYRALVAGRRAMYRAGWLRSEHAGRPVVVVGNVIAGGAGKTPVVMAVVRHLQARGLRVGVVSRGYGRSTTDCRAVTPDSPVSEVGDEPALIARSFATGPAAVPVFVAPRRIAAARALLAAHPETDLIVCDDGLQHLALQRDVEICVFNNEGVGNAWLLPAGPLREPWPRPVDFVLHAGATAPAHEAGGLAFGLQRSLAPWAVQADGTRVLLASLHGQPLHAVAAVARPGDFFAMLRDQGLDLAHAEPLPDHYDFDSWKRLSDKRTRLICTEKDAVKLWVRHPDALAVPLQVQLPAAFFAALDIRLCAVLPSKRAAQYQDGPNPPLSSPSA